MAFFRSGRGDGLGAAARYRALEAARRPFLERAREAARLTIPSLCPPTEQRNADLPTPYQGVGARGVNALTNKLLLAQFPPNTPFFRLTVDEELLGAAEAASEQDLRGEVESALQRLERAVMSDIETGFARAGLHMALKLLIATGNALIHLPPEGGLRVFRLDRYVVRRGPSGAPEEILVQEETTLDALPKRTRTKLGAASRAGQQGDGASPQKLPLYTWIRRNGAGWSVAQEVGGVEVVESRGAYSEGGLDWLALRWSHVDGEDYGRGHVEEQIGDLKSLEGLMQAIVEGSAAASKLTILVNPAGQTDAEELAEAENGAIIDGLPGDVAMVQANKFNDFRVAFQTVEILTRRLSHAFLLHEAATRDASSVTAEEIRFMAAELEDALGGVYSVLAEELQRPLVEALLRRKIRAGAVPPMPAGLLKPLILTGLEALGRGQDFNRLTRFMSFLSMVGGVAASPAGGRLDASALILRGAAALGVDASGLLRPEGDVAADEAQAVGLQLLKELGPDALAAPGEPAGPAGVNISALDPEALSEAGAQMVQALAQASGDPESAAAAGEATDAADDSDAGSVQPTHAAPHAQAAPSSAKEPGAATH
ncbi:MAG: portal protein [Neomegalonema sp.]|nr:portal protein [Neomegalonema sp.]